MNAMEYEASPFGQLKIRGFHESIKFPDLPEIRWRIAHYEILYEGSEISNLDLDRVSAPPPPSRSVCGETPKGAHAERAMNLDRSSEIKMLQCIALLPLLFSKTVSTKDSCTV